MGEVKKAVKDTAEKVDKAAKNAEDDKKVKAVETAVEKSVEKAAKTAEGALRRLRRPQMTLPRNLMRQRRKPRELRKNLKKPKRRLVMPRRRLRRKKRKNEHLDFVIDSLLTTIIGPETNC